MGALIKKYQRAVQVGEAVRGFDWFYDQQENFGQYCLETASTNAGEIPGVGEMGAKELVFKLLLFLMEHEK